jgi:hypothetical protein
MKAEGHDSAMDINGGRRGGAETLIEILAILATYTAQINLGNVASAVQLSHAVQS